MSGSECHDSQSWGYRITEEMEIAVVSDYSDYHTKPWSRRHSPYAPFRGWGVGGLIAWLLLVAVVGLVYRQTLTPVTLIVDGRAMAMRTSQDTISALLVNAGVTLRPEDIVVPGDLNQALEPGGQVIVRHAQPVYVCTDGQEALFYTQATSWVDVLNEARVSVGPYDEVIVEGWLAAEASGHFFFRELAGDDGLYAALRVTELLSRSGRRLSQLRKTIPPFHITPDIRIRCREPAAVIEAVKKAFEGHPQDHTDGVRVEFEGGWALVRPSVTEPAVTVRVEGDCPERMDRLRAEVLDAVRRSLPPVDSS